MVRKFIIIIVLQRDFKNVKSSAKEELWMMESFTRFPGPNLCNIEYTEAVSGDSRGW